MSQEADEEVKKQNKKDKNLDPSILDPPNPSSFDFSMWIEIIKRFFYQILGIYLPALILFLFFYMNYNTVVLSYARSLPEFIVEDYKLLLLVFGSVLLGEAINAITSWLTRISPVSLTLKDRLKLLFTKGPVHIWIDDVPWPLWINIASFPVSFAVFDRYYLGTLDEDRKALAGRIGWTAFYRNCGFVFVLIFLMQLPSMLSAMHSLLIGDAMSGGPLASFVLQNLPPNVYIRNIIFSLDILLPYIFPIALIPLFILAYSAQISSHKKIFWNAYRRNELRKILEAKHGDIPLALGVKEKYKKRAYDYITDRWFHAAELSVKDLSRHLISEAEGKYSTKMKDIKSNEEFILKSSKYRPWKPITYYVLNLGSLFSKDNFTNEISKLIVEAYKDHFEKEISKLIVEAYKEYYVGNYEITMTYAIRVLNKLNKLTEDKSKGDDDTRFWKKLKGRYMITFTLRTEAAYREIVHNLHRWDWIISSQIITKDDEGKHTSSDLSDQFFFDEHSVSSDFTEAHYSKAAYQSDSSAQLVWESADDYHKAFRMIRKAIGKLSIYREGNPLSYSLEGIYSYHLENIYEKLGGHDYNGAAKEAYRLYNLLSNPYHTVDISTVTESSNPLFFNTGFLRTSFF
jgi:hypothetical protein